MEIILNMKMRILLDERLSDHEKNFNDVIDFDQMLDEIEVDLLNLDFSQRKKL